MHIVPPPFEAFATIYAEPNFRGDHQILTTAGPSVGLEASAFEENPEPEVPGWEEFWRSRLFTPSSAQLLSNPRGTPVLTLFGGPRYGGKFIQIANTYREEPQLVSLAEFSGLAVREAVDQLRSTPTMTELLEVDEAFDLRGRIRSVLLSVVETGAISIRVSFLDLVRERWLSLVDGFLRTVNFGTVGGGGAVGTTKQKLAIGESIQTATSMSGLEVRREAPFFGWFPFPVNEYGAIAGRPGEEAFAQLPRDRVFLGINQPLIVDPERSFLVRAFEEVRAGVQEQITGEDTRSGANPFRAMLRYRILLGVTQQGLLTGRVYTLSPFVQPGTRYQRRFNRVLTEALRGGEILHSELDSQLQLQNSQILRANRRVKKVTLLPGRQGPYGPSVFEVHEFRTDSAESDVTIVVDLVAAPQRAADRSRAERRRDTERLEHAEASAAGDNYETLE